MNTATLALADNKIAVTGVLTFDVVPQLRIEGEKLIKQTAAKEFDFSAVTRADSSVLALLIVWVRCARKYKKEIIFSHLPMQLLAIAKMSGLDKLLPILNPS